MSDLNAPFLEDDFLEEDDLAEGAIVLSADQIETELAAARAELRRAVRRDAGLQAAE